VRTHLEGADPGGRDGDLRRGWDSRTRRVELVVDITLAVKDAIHRVISTAAGDRAVDSRYRRAREDTGTSTVQEQFRAGWDSAGWLVPFTLYLLPASLAAAPLWRVIAPPPPTVGPPVPGWVVVGSAGLLLGLAIMFLLGMLVLRLARWAAGRLSDRTTRSALSAQLDSSPVAALHVSLSGIVRLILIATRTLFGASKE
jgi:hypothetical protein